MDKYVVKHAPDDSDDADHEWYVEFTEGGLPVQLNGLRESEANIMAWALNAVAEGHGLIAVTGGTIKDWQVYDGPTEGVRLVPTVHSDSAEGRG